MTLFHFSEDPAIKRFEPHVPATQPDAPPYVWAMDEERAPLYWFPRDCPRATFWPRLELEPTDTQLALLGGRRRRVHAIEWAWLERVRTCELYVYDFAGDSFAHHDNGMWVSPEPVVPIGVRPVGDLLALHEGAGIELRLVENLWPLWDLVITSGLAFSGVRLRNATPPSDRMRDR